MSAGVDGLAAELDRRLATADRELTRRFPGDRGVRQPVHTMYVPADRYTATTVPSSGRQALAVLREHADTPGALARATGVPPATTRAVYDRLREKLAREPVEDLRVDFEDGYGVRPDDEEDAAAVDAAGTLAASLRAGTASPFHGIRFKSFEAPTRRRGLATLWRFVETLHAAGGLTDGFVLTLPKVTSVDQVDAMVLVCERLEAALAVPAGTLRFEIQVETPQSVLGPDGTALVARMVHATGGRCLGLHYGTYDYSAACGIAAQQQSLEHPAADHAKAVMQTAAAGTGVFLSDGSTNVLPVGDAAEVRAAWRLHTRLVRRSLERGFYQGWDLHPAQLPTRYLATYSFYREGLAEATCRLRSYVGGGDSGWLDEPATAVALAGFVLRALDCGAAATGEVEEMTGIDTDRLAVLARRRAERAQGRR